MSKVQPTNAKLHQRKTKSNDNGNLVLNNTNFESEKKAKHEQQQFCKTF